MALVLTVYWLLGRRRGQNGGLVIASAVFYGFIHPWFLCLLYGSTLLDFFCARAMSGQPAHRKRFLIASLVGNLGLLGIFKYLGFFVESFRELATIFGFDGASGTREIILPGLLFVRVAE
mgnify:CR=1 FL=1